MRSRKDRPLLHGRRLRGFVHTDDERVLAAHLRQCAHTDGLATCELRLRNGTPVRLWSRPTPTPPRRYATVIADVLEQERAREEVRRLAQLGRQAQLESEAKDRFIAALSHELRTPLTPVLAAVSALRERTDIPETLRPVCEMIRRNITTEARLIDDLLDVTRIARGKVSLERMPLDVHEVVREVVETLQSDTANKRLSLRLELEAEQHVAAIDPVRFKQVLWNLLRNAIKFTSEGGHVAFRSWNTGPGTRARLALEVSDDGQGFDPSDADRLFEAFEQGAGVVPRSGGLGLGLAISKGLVELHGGRLTASSRGRGMGARFVIEIETTGAQPAVPERRAPAVEQVSTGKPFSILLVDDDEDTAEMLHDLLCEVGYQVRVAHSVTEALESDIDAIDVIVSDIGLPDASGLDLMRRLRASRSDAIRGVAFSGYGTEADVRASLDAGFERHLTKPIDFARLLAAIRGS